jgi:hypothetical protein
MTSPEGAKEILSLLSELVHQVPALRPGLFLFRPVGALYVFSALRLCGEEFWRNWQEQLLVEMMEDAGYDAGVSSISRHNS